MTERTPAAAPLRNPPRSLAAFVTVVAVVVGGAVLAACGSSDDGSTPSATLAGSTPSTSTTTSGPVASTYDTIPLDTSAAETATTVPAQMHDLRADGIGLLRIGMSAEDLLASGTATNPHPGCEGDTVDDQYDLAIGGVTGVVIIVEDDIGGFAITSGRVTDAGAVGSDLDAFEAAIGPSWNWNLDRDFESTHGIWIGTLTDRNTGDTVDVVVDPETTIVEEAAVPAIAFCG